MSNVTEKDIRDLIAKYPNPKGSCLNSFAYHIPMTQRNLEIIGKMSKYMGTLNKKYRGPRHGNRAWCDSLPKAYAEKVSLYARNYDKAKAFLENKPLPEVKVETMEKQLKSTQEYANKKATEAHQASWSARSAKQHLDLNAQIVHDVVVLPIKSYNLVLEYLAKIV